MNILKVDLFINSVLNNKFIWNTDYPSQAPEYFDTSKGRVVCQDVLNYSISKKRMGDYDASIDSYIDFLELMNKGCGYVSPGIARGLFKSLMAANYYFYAYSLVKYLYNKMLAKIPVENQMDYRMTLYYLSEDIRKIDSCINKAINNSYSEILQITKEYSGNSLYTFVRSKDDIRKDFISIKNTKM